MGITSIATRNVARKRPFLRVDSLVPNQRALLRKAGVTTWKVAFERPFSRMGPHMSLQVTWAIEASITIREVTFERLSCVGTHVILQAALLRKACSTFFKISSVLGERMMERRLLLDDWYSPSSS